MRSTEFIHEIGSPKPSPVYFLRGPDRFLHDECRAAVLAAVPPEVRAWCLTLADFESGRLGAELDNARQMPMLGGRSYILVTDTDDFRHAGDEDFEALDVYLKNPPPFATVVFAAAEPDRRRRFVQLLEKKAAVVDIRSLDRAEAARWLEQYLRRAGVSISPELAREVAARFEDRPDPRSDTKPGVNLLGLRTEVEKVLTARPDAREWGPDELEEIVSFREDHEIHRLVEAIAERDLTRSITHLRALLSSKEPEALILWSIGDLFRQALKQSSASAAPGGRSGGFTPYQRSWPGAANRPSTANFAERAAQRYSPEELGRAMRRTRDTDLAVKSSWKDSKVLLEVLIWQVTAGWSGGAWAEPGWEGSSNPSGD